MIFCLLRCKYAILDACLNLKKKMSEFDMMGGGLHFSKMSENQKCLKCPMVIDIPIVQRARGVTSMKMLTFFFTPPRQGIEIRSFLLSG